MTAKTATAKTVKTVTASDVRNFFRADDKRMAALSEAAAKTVAPGARGRLHPEVVEIHNKRRKTAQYVTGATKEAKAVAVADALALRVAAFDAGLAVGARGRLSREVKETLGLVKPKPVAKAKGKTNIKK